MVLGFEHLVQNIKDRKKKININIIDKEFVNIYKLSLILGASLYKHINKTNRTEENLRFAKKGLAVMYAMKHGQILPSNKISIGKLLQYMENADCRELTVEEWSDFEIERVTNWILSGFFDTSVFQSWFDCAV